MNNFPVVYAKTTVALPATALPEHVALQQHIAVLIQQPDYKERQSLVAFRELDLYRLFPESMPSMPREFYILASNTLNYVSLKAKMGENELERFGSIVAMSQSVVESIMDFHGFLNDIYTASEKLPELRMTLLMNSEAFMKHELASRLTVISEEQFKEMKIELKFSEESKTWVPNDEPIPEEVEKQRMHLKDIPLTTRASRMLLRNSITQHRDRLEDLHVKSGAQISFEEWMVQAQGVNVQALKDLEGIDNLPDDQYVEAIVAFKKGEVQAYHSQAVKAQQTDMHLFDWTKMTFGVEFNELGRAEAQAELEGTTLTQEADYSADENEPAVFLVTFDGTIVENMKPAIGPDSPYALGVLKTLQKNGHKLFIFTERHEEHRDAMLQFLSDSDIHPIGTVSSLNASGEILSQEVQFVDPDDVNSFEYIDIDYFVDHRQFGISTIQISNGTEPTYYWTDLVETLNNYGYLSDEDVVAIMEDLQEKADNA